MSDQPRSLFDDGRKLSYLTLGECIAYFDAKATERDKAIAALADDQCGREGEVEIDNAILSEGEDNGAYVLAWVWVDFSGTPFDKEDVCKWCNADIRSDGKGGWVDDTDGDGCGEHVIEGQPHGSHEPEGHDA